MKQINTIKGLENVRDYYYITTCGKIIGRNGVLKTRLNKGGYETIVMSTNDKPRKKINYLVHRLVALAYIPNPENKPQVNHIDEVKTHNYVQNLEWVTAKENSNWGTRNEKVRRNQTGELNHMYGKKNQWLTEYNRHRTRDKNPNSKPKEYFSINAVTRGSFKRTCETQGWEFEDFEEIFAIQIIDKKGLKKDKKYYYKLKDKGE